MATSVGTTWKSSAVRARVMIDEDGGFQYNLFVRYSGSGNSKTIHLGLTGYRVATGNSVGGKTTTNPTVTYYYKRAGVDSDFKTLTSSSDAILWPTGQYKNMPENVSDSTIEASSSNSYVYDVKTFTLNPTSNGTYPNITLKYKVTGGAGQYTGGDTSVWTAESGYDAPTQSQWPATGVTWPTYEISISATPTAYNVYFDKYLDGSKYTNNDITIDLARYTTYETTSTTTCTTGTTNSAKYSFSGWFKDSSASASWTTKTTGDINVSSNTGSTYHAKWTTNTCTVSSTTYTNGVVNTSGGNITISPVTVAYGGSTVLTATVNSGYRFLGWYSTSTGAIIGGSTDRLATTISYTLSNVTSNTTVYPSFISRYTIETLTVPLDGGTISGATEVDSGGSTTLTAIPNEHYEFAGWSIGYDDTAPTIFSNPLELTNITEDKIVFAYFMYLLSIKRRIISG